MPHLSLSECVREARSAICIDTCVFEPVLPCRAGSGFAKRAWFKLGLQLVKVHFPSKPCTPDCFVVYHISLSKSRFLIASLFSYFLFPLARAISSFILPSLVYMAVGTSINLPCFILLKSPKISLRCSSNFRLLVGS